jgi:amino acid transporter/nucleotide-binding universal stress UspA family protein
MSTTEGPPPSASGLARRLARPAQVLIVSSVMFTFISYWRTAAVVLCDLASTVYYIGGIVENAIGPAAPWFILAVMLFSYAVRSVYIESCSLFVRGGVYRVVKEAMGGFLAKLSVSALMFDYILTGPTSGVSAGQYLMGLLLQFVRLFFFSGMPAQDLPDYLLTDAGHTGELVQRYGSVILAVSVTLYFFWQNLRGIHESSNKALKIMYATTVMAVVILVWCGITLLVNGPSQSVPLTPDLNTKLEHEEIAATEAPDQSRYNKEEKDVWIRDKDSPDRLKPKEEEGRKVAKENEAFQEMANVTGTTIHHPDDPLGFLAGTGIGEALRNVGTPGHPGWLSLIGMLGLFLAFGHSILAMSGEETLAQVYREVESPKLKNFKRAAFIVFVYSVVLTAGISFLAVLIIPDEVRMKFYSGNLISGLARHVAAPQGQVGDIMKLGLETFVVVVGFLILAGAVNTAIIGSNGVLNRVAEDGVLPDWFLKPHPRYGTTYRVLTLIASLQVGVIVASMGHVLVLGEAYAFGVVWSFVFKALAMVVLRFKDKTPREYKVPLNVRVGRVEIPVGLILIFLVLLTAAVLNFFTKEVATVSGLIFTAGFLTVFVLSERYHEKKRGPAAHHHMEQFNRQQAPEVSLEGLGITKPYRKLVAIRSTQNLFMLEKALNEADPDTTAVIVMTAKVIPVGESSANGNVDLDAYDQQLMTAVVDKAEHAGKEVKPLIVPTNNPLHAVLQTAANLQANEVVMGASNKYTADEQLEQIAFYWISMHHGTPAPLTVRVLGADRDMALDLGGGNRVPKISERRARTVAELRAAGVGVDRVLLLHDGTPDSSDLFRELLTMLDPQVLLAVAPVAPAGEQPPTSLNLLPHDTEQARHLGRDVRLLPLPGGSGEEIVRAAREGQYDLIVLALPAEPPAGQTDRVDARARFVMERAHCRVFLAAAPLIPHEVVDTRQAPGG